MPDLDDLHNEFVRWIEAFTNLDVEAVLATGHGAGYGYRVLEARSHDRLSPEEARRRVETALASYDYFRIRDPEWHGRVDGDIGIQWGFFTEEFQNKGFDPEVRRVRFSCICRWREGAWVRLWEHRDSQDFDDSGRYYRTPLGDPAG